MGERMLRGILVGDEVAVSPLDEPLDDSGSDRGAVDPAGHLLPVDVHDLVELVLEEASELSRKKRREDVLVRALANGAQGQLRPAVGPSRTLWGRQSGACRTRRRNGMRTRTAPGSQ